MGFFKISTSWLCGLLLLLKFSSTSQAFTISTTTALWASRKLTDTSSPLWGGSGGGGLFGFEKSKEVESPTESLPPPTDVSVPTTRVLEVPVSSIKRGGLRFALGLHLIGLEEKGTWRPNQSSENVLDMYFKDNSAMFKLIFDDDAIRVDRIGRPSLVYLLQESMVLHSVMDELTTLCFNNEISPENRLLQLKGSGDAIEKARSILPARKA